jgi:hypothetical protein
MKTVKIYSGIFIPLIACVCKSSFIKTGKRVVFPVETTLAQIHLISNLFFFL